MSASNQSGVCGMSLGVGGREREGGWTRVGLQRRNQTDQGGASEEEPDRPAGLEAVDLGGA